MFNPEGIMHRKINFWIVILLLIGVTIAASLAIATQAQTSSGGGGGGDNAIMSTLAPSVPQITSPYGGEIMFSIECSTVSSCINVSTGLTWIICLIVRCILQFPFILHVFQNYYVAPDQIGAFDGLRDSLAEPQESSQCDMACGSYADVGVISLSPSLTCQIWCNAVLPALQEANVSPAGLAVTGMQEIFSAALPTMAPGISLILFPEEGGLPACSSQGYLLGTGFGQGLYFTLPQLHVAGDSCRGNYFPSQSAAGGI